MMVLRRLDILLEPTHEDVLKQKKLLDASAIPEESQEQVLFGLTRYPFCNTSRFTMKSLRGETNPIRLKQNFLEYLDGFSRDVQDIIEKFRLKQQVDNLSDAGRLGSLIERFTDDNINLGINPVLDTNTSSKMTSENALERLTLFLDANQSERVRYEIVTQREGEDAQLTVCTENIYSYANPKLFEISISCDVIREMANIDQATKLLAVSIHVGERAFTYYVSQREPQIRMFFRNAFNVFECCELEAVTTQIAESERSIAVTNRISTFYNQRNEKKYEVETSGLTYEQAQWIEQLFYSHDVRMGKLDEEMEPWDIDFTLLPKVLITDFTCEIDDADGELNTVKFTYQFADRRTWLQTDYLTVDHDRIFTEQYDPTFQ